MRYMLLIYTKEDEVMKASEEAMQGQMAAHRAAMEEARRRGVFESAEPLASTASATTVRVREGKTLTVDGPFAETKEQLAGYYILDCKDLDEAIEWATRIPTGCGGGEGCVEIRPFRTLPRRAKDTTARE
jgi:hypothetical protein